jgi:hypothetical protein
MSEVIEILKKTRIFGGLEDEELRLVEPHVKQEVYKSADIVFTRLDQATRLYIVRSGLLKANIEGEALRELRPYDSFGEIALINKGVRMGTVVAAEDSVLYSIGEEVILSDKILPSQVVVKILTALAKQVVSYLSPGIYRTSEILIEAGETARVEFKTTLRYNLYTKKYGREIEHAALKSIAAFLNSKGGTLLIGIDDSGQATGIGQDQFENQDKALLYLTNLVKERIGMQYLKFINAYMEEVHGKMIMRVDVAPSSLPAYLTNNQDEYFYIRTGPATSELRVSEIYDYIHNHFFKATH